MTKASGFVIEIMVIICYSIIIKELTKIYDDVNGIYGYRRMTMNINRNLNFNIDYFLIFDYFTDFYSNYFADGWQKAR